MNILYLAHRIPYPPNKGDKLRSFRQLDRLAQQHNVWCGCFVDDPADEQHVSELRRRCVDVAAVRLSRPTALRRGLIGLARGRTLTESYYSSQRMTRIVREWSATVGFDAVMAFSSSMAQYASIPRARRVLDLCDRDSQKWMDYATLSPWPVSTLYRLEGQRLAKLEGAILREFDATILITPAEADGFGPPAAAQKLHIIGNGVDCATAPSCSSRLESVSDEQSENREGHQSRQYATERLIVGFMGAMNYRPNVDAVRWFVRECWPAICRAHQNVEFRIVGRAPTSAVKRLERVPGVVVVGEVSDASLAVSEFDISVAPLRIARGLQNKVLEAMAHSKPVVLSNGAAVGLSGTHGREYMVADGAAEFTECVSRLIADPAERQRLAQAGRAYVQAHHCWDTELDRLEKVVTGAAVPRNGDLTLPPKAAVNGRGRGQDEQVGHPCRRERPALLNFDA